MKRFLVFAIIFVSLLLVSCDNSDKTEEMQEENNVSLQEETQKEETKAPEKVYLKYESDTDFFELPLNGATGFAPIDLNVRAEGTTNSKLLMTLEKGTPFVILEEVGDWWKIEVDSQIGYVYHPFAFINLPDVLPSAVYQNTNASSSLLKSSFTDIPNITGEKLYDASSRNERLDKDEFIMPVLYSTAKKIAHAQNLALKDGNTLVICELYRPYDVQQKIVSELTTLSNENSEILEGITKKPWSISWFIATSISNHQKGYAIDTSLAKVSEFGKGISGEYEYTDVLAFDEFEMQTPIHELSFHSASLAYPVTSYNDTAWREVENSENFTAESVLLRDYMTNAGLTPLASEWWHFNDLESAESALSVGDYFIEEIVSTTPEN